MRKIINKILSCISIKSNQEFNQKAFSDKLNKFCEYQKQLRSNLIHDIRTPLLNIKLSADMQSRLLQKFKKKDLPSDSNIFDKFEQYFHTIIFEIKQINLYIDQILDLEKNPFEEHTLNIKRTDLKKDLQLIIQKYQNIYSEDNRAFEYLYNCIDNFQYVDNDKIIRIISNLLSNAIKYTEKGKITLRVTEDEKKLFIFVEDNGCGIPKSKLDVIFERFTQAGGDHQKPGNGIGLNITSHLIKLHSGTIETSSEEGQGTIFKLTLPKFQSDLYDK
ncbi:hypothetical protein BVX93_00980 [bacterium B13(2017)]|nr:hypothetical protein BVX93_00980 [bacterium B13(2017)]